VSVSVCSLLTTPTTDHHICEALDLSLEMAAGRRRRRMKVRVGEEDQELLELTCEGCRLLQKNVSRHRIAPPTSKDHKVCKFTRDVLKTVSDSDSEDSAIESGGFSSETGSVTSENTTSDFYERQATPQRKTAVVSIQTIKDIEEALDLEALAEFVTGTPLQRFTSRQPCPECIHTYSRNLHEQEHYFMRFHGVDDSFYCDLTGKDTELYVEEHWGLSEPGYKYCVSTQGALYYTDTPPETKPISLPRQLMVPPSERQTCKNKNALRVCLCWVYIHPILHCPT